jgi:pyruvate dehydrogenase E1 component alpha subunit
MDKEDNIKYNFYKSDSKWAYNKLGSDGIKEVMRQMLLARHFDVRAESAYQMGKMGGFFHASIGKEAVDAAAVSAFGPDNWYIATYRCHALSVMLGGNINELMAELYGKATGIVKGRGGSMHLCLDNMLGGFGIVGGHLPIAAGAGFSIKYLQSKDRKLAICFLGEGAVAQGSFHEAINLVSLWDLPCIFIIENNHWGMGTATNRAISHQPIAESQCIGYGIKGYTVDGMDFFNCYQAFSEIADEVIKTERPVLIEAITSRFRGHSISDPGLYRSKEELQEEMKRDPVISMKQYILDKKIMNEEEYSTIDNKQKEIVKEAMKFADTSPWPDPVLLEEDVLAEETNL